MFESGKTVPPMSVQQQQQTITIAISIMIQQFWLPKKESKHPIVNPPSLLHTMSVEAFVLKEKHSLFFFFKSGA